MAVQTINVSGIAELRFVLAANTQFYFTGAVDNQKLRLILQQPVSGGPFTVSSGNCPGLQQPNATAGDSSAQELTYDAVTNTWNGVPPPAIGGNSQAPQIIAYGASGAGLAINKNAGMCILNGGGVVAATLVQPVAGPPGIGDDGVVLKIVSGSANAHTVKTSADGISPAADTITFGTVGAGVTLQAFDAVWYMIGGVAATPTEA
jgi:hypothetical protein